MKAFTTHKGLVAPLDRENVDTDLIIPKQFLKSIKRTGFGPNLFDELRYLDHGEPGMDNSKRPLNPDFSLNQPRYQGASILLTRKNFGCGSSREHAPWINMAFARLSRLHMQTSSSTTVSRMVCCPLCFRKKKCLVCSKSFTQTKATASRSTCPARWSSHPTDASWRSR